MRQPNFTNKQFLDQTTLNTAFSTTAQSLQDTIAYTMTAAGVLQPSSLVFSSSGLTLTVTGNTPFAVLFSTGIIGTMLGGASGSTTNTVTLDLSSYVPSTGSQTVYIVASPYQLYLDPIIIYGPPVGDPNYSTAFTPQQAYTTVAWSLNVTATTTAPTDSSTTIELGRLVLNAGITTLPTVITSYQPLAAFAINYDSVVNALGYIPLSNAIFADNNTWTGTNQFSNSVTIGTSASNQTLQILGNLSVTGTSTLGTVSAGSVSGTGFTIGGNSVVTSFNGRYGAITPQVGDYSLSQIGTVSLSSPAIGQVLTYNGTVWTNESPPASPVTSVFGRTGAVTAEAGDYSAYYGQLSVANTWSANQTLSSAQSGTAVLNSPVFTLQGWTGSAAAYMSAYFNASNNYIEMTANGSGTVLFSFSSAGDLVASGTISAGSSRALKEDIKTFDEKDAEKLLTLSPVKFRYKNSQKDSFGFISEEMREVYPELVDSHVPFLPLNYSGLMAPLVQLVKKLYRRIEALEQRVSYDAHQ